MSSKKILKISDFFDLKKIVDSGQCFRACVINDDEYLFICRNRVLKIKKLKGGNYEADWDDFWKRYFDLSRDYKKIKPKDEFMQKAANFSKGIRIIRQDPWETLISFIISQRKSIPAIKTSVERLCKNFGDYIADDIYAFPTPEQLFKADFNVLKKCGLGYRINYIMDVVKFIFSENIDLQKWDKFDTAMLLENLLSLSGVGPKVANCVALFAYGRTECAPVDTWIDKAIQLYYNGKNPFPQYGSDAGIMQQYLFYYILNHKIN